MTTAIPALLAALIHDARTADVDAAGVELAATLLARATGGEAVSVGFDGAAGRLAINGLPVAVEVPGAAQLAEALQRHGTWRLDLPAGMTPVQWQGIGTVYAAGPGIYPTPAHVEAAVVGIAPGASVRAAREGNLHDADTRLESISITVEGEPAVEVDPSILTSSGADRGELSSRLDPLLDAGAAAVGARDWSALAGVLEQLSRLQRESDGATQAILVREQRRLLPDQVVTELVQRLPMEGSTSDVAQVARFLGRRAAEAMIDLLVAEPGRAERRVLIDVLARTEGIDELVTRHIGSRAPALARDMAEVAERRRLESAIPALAAQLHSGDPDVRTACWRALEAIGTVEALAALNRGR